MNNIKLKPMVLIFKRDGNMWNRQVRDLQGNIIYESKPELMFPEYDADYFSAWEKQIKQLKCFNIVDCERFI